MAKEEQRSEAQPEWLLQFFEYSHLPKHLWEVSKPYADLARVTVETLPRCPERTVALRKLLEAKDAAVRTAVWHANQPRPTPSPGPGRPLP